MLDGAYLKMFQIIKPVRTGHSGLFILDQVIIIPSNLQNKNVC